MKRFYVLSAVLAMLVLVTSLSFAQTIRASAPQTVTLSVNAIYRLSISGNPSLAITDATAGSGLTSATEGTSTYRVTMNQPVAKLTAKLSAALGTGVDLIVNVGSSRGAPVSNVSLRDANAHDVVTGLSRGADNGQPITYTLTASTDADPFGPTAFTVTWTLQH